MTVGAEPTDAVQLLSDLKVLLGHGDHFGHMWLVDGDEGFVVEQELSNRQRDLQVDEVVGPEEEVVGPVSHLVETHRLLVKVSPRVSGYDAHAGSEVSAERKVHSAWSGERSMATAQSLFEQGLITYPRSNSIHISPEARNLARQIIRERHGFTALKDFSLGVGLLRTPTSPAGAHEAIRPADPMQLPEHQAGLLPDQATLYKLIWERFIASQMQAARYQVIQVELESA